MGSFIAEKGLATDNINIGALIDIQEKINWKTIWQIEKYENDEALKADRPYEVKELPGNLLLNEGITEMLNLLIGAAATNFNNTNARIGVGDSNTAAAATQTGLQAAMNKLYKAMDSGYPQVSNQTVTWRATFGAGEAAYAWNEFTIANGADDAAKNLNRKVDTTIGTKGSSPTWVISLTVTIS
jgi:hypothetical protein